MKKILLVLLLFSVSCTPSAEDLVNDLLDDSEYEEEEEYYECYSGNATLPFGDHPEELITPGGYKWECTGGVADSIRFDADGTFSADINKLVWPTLFDYFSDCPGNFNPNKETGEWVVSRGRLCVKNDNIQPGLYNCQRITYGPGTVKGSICATYYEDGHLSIGTECDRNSRLGSCTLEEE